MQKLFFEPYVPQKEISIKDLKKRFDTMSLYSNRTLQLARYLIESKTDTN